MKKFVILIVIVITLTTIGYANTNSPQYYDPNTGKPVFDLTTALPVEPNFIFINQVKGLDAGVPDFPNKNGKYDFSKYAKHNYYGSKSHPSSLSLAVPGTPYMQLADGVIGISMEFDNTVNKTYSILCCLYAISDTGEIIDSISKIITLHPFEITNGNIGFQKNKWGYHWVKSKLVIKLK